MLIFAGNVYNKHRNMLLTTTPAIEISLLYNLLYTTLKVQNCYNTKRDNSDILYNQYLNDIYIFIFL